MKRQWIATALAMISLGLPQTKAIAQANMVNGSLNLKMRQALCAQDWVRAVRVIDQMKKATPFYRQELNYYRARLVILRNQGARVPAWPSPSYCAGNEGVFPNDGEEAKTDTANTTPANPAALPFQPDSNTLPPPGM